jgi:hypothetical protein
LRRELEMGQQLGGTDGQSASCSVFNQVSTVRSSKLLMGEGIDVRLSQLRHSHLPTFVGPYSLSLLLSPWTGQRLDFSFDQVIYADKHRIDDDVFRSLSYPPCPRL